MRYTSFGRLFGKGRQAGASRGRRQRAARPWGALIPGARPTLEALEDRTLLAVVPAPIASPMPVNISSSTRNDNTPSLAIDPTNPMNLVSVYVENMIPGNQPVAVFGRFSVNGGTTWSSFVIPGNFPDPTNLNVPLHQATDPSVGFDRAGNVYVLWSQHTDDDLTGTIVLDKFHLMLTPFPMLVPVFSAPEHLYNWAMQGTQGGLGNGSALNPTLAINTNQATFTDPANPAYTQTDPTLTRLDPALQAMGFTPIYVAWNINLLNPATNPNPPVFNYVQVMVSTDGGLTFTAAKDFSSTGFDASPQIAISQGTRGNPLTGQTAVTGGQATVVSDQFGPTPHMITVPPNATPHNGDFLNSRIIPDGGVGAVFPGQVGPYQEAAQGMMGSDIPATTNFTANADFTTPLAQGYSYEQLGFTSSATITGLTVTMDVIDQDINAVSFTLLGPSGQRIPLILNHINAMGQTINGQGINGPNLGMVMSGNNLTPWDTVFDDNAIDPINDTAHVMSPYAGHYLPEGGLLPLTMSRAAATGTWTLQVVDFRHNSDMPNQQIVKWSLNMTAHLTNDNNSLTIPDALAAKTFTRGVRLAGDGQTGSQFPTAPAGVPVPGIGPAPVIASDNTLGAFSPYQGRLYIAYAGSANNTNDDNTKIWLVTSTNGGASWSAPLQVENDNDNPLLDPNHVDGFSEGNLLTGRPYTQPQITVDQYTGTLVISFYDGRYDAARARFATTVTVSIDGGRTFSDQPWVNSSLTIPDAVTGKLTTLEPLPENQSTGNGSRDSMFGFGTHQGLVAALGIIHPLWTWNQDGGLGMTTTPDNIYFSTAVYAAGPRVVSSTQGQATAVRLVNKVFNNTFTATGLPLVDGIGITFDRPVNPASLTANDVEVFYHSTDPGSNPVQIAVSTDPQPLDLGSLVPGEAFSYFISFDQQQTGTGTYSYVVLPNVMDQLRSFDASGNLVMGNLMDQNHNAITSQQPTQATGGDSYNVPTPLNNGPNFLAPYDQNTLPIIVPGPHVMRTAVPGNSNSDPNLVINNANSFIDVVFDRDMDPTSFTAASVLSMMGPAGPVRGPFEIIPNPVGTDPDPAHPRTFRIEFPTQVVDGTYTVTLSPTLRAENGDQLDTSLNAGVDILFQRPTAGTTAVTYVNHTPLTILPNSTVSSTITVPDTYVVQGLTIGNQNTPGLDITFPDDRTLQAWLVAPDGTQIQLFTHVGTQGPTFNDFSATVLDDAAITPIQNGHAPFNGIFNPQQPLSVLKNHLVSGIYRLFIENDGSGTGTLQDWSLVFQKAVSQTGLGEPVADQATVSFRLFVDGKNLPQAHQAWTAVGPASINNGLNSGRIGGLALDPSDPSGNTVYAAGASGGVWKTTNFLTTNPAGPTWMPLTDLGPTFGVNIGGLAVFGRNNDPKLSMVFAATGEGDTLLPAASANEFGFTEFGDGIIRSEDGGGTWTLLDSTDNTLPYAQRDHLFRGSTAFKVVTDPSPSPFAANQAVVYVAFSGPHGGIWKSFDSGDHWALMKAGQATDIALVPTTQDPAQGNTLRWVYAGFSTGSGGGVYFSDSAGSNWTQLLGGVGDPTLVDPGTIPPTPIPVNAPAGDPNGAKGRVTLATPAATGNPAQDLSYQGWIYAYVSTTGGTTDGLYVTKDRGQNWTKINVNIAPDSNSAVMPPLNEIPTNDNARPNVDILGAKANSEGAQGNYDITVTVDPTNPNIVYLGGTADAQPPGYTEIQVDTTALDSPHDVLAYDYFRNDGGSRERDVTGPVALKMPGIVYGYVLGITDTPYLNLFRDPNAPFTSASTLQVIGVNHFANDGIRAPLDPWRPIDPLGSTDQHRIISMIDPLTGRTRLIFGDDQGIFSLVADPVTGQFGDGSVPDSIGTSALGTGSRNGNIQITQFYGGAAQPSQNAANQAGVSGFFYGSAQDDGYPASDKNVLQNGNIAWTGPGGDSQWVATDQAKNLPGTSYLGSVYHYVWPCCNTYESTLGQGSFFLVNNIPHVQGLLQHSPTDPQWPFAPGFNFAVNPIDGNDIVISSGAGRVFRTNDQGLNWTPIGEPSALDGTNAPALAYGAPDPNDPTHQLDNFIYAGTDLGNIFVTFNAGGTWTKFGTAQGLDSFPVEAIAANPRRGSHEAYAVTLAGVYYCPDTSAPGARWQSITNGLFLNQHNIFGDSSMPEQQLYFLQALAVDWRFQIPDDPANPNGPKHPMLYVGGQGGVFRSADKGQTWNVFPSVAKDGAAVNGGFLPNIRITHLELSLGEIDPNTGLPDPAGGEDLLLASTYGRGEFMIRVPNPQPIEQVFVQGVDNQVYAEKLNANGQPVGSYFLTTPGQVNQEVVGYTAFNLPEVFVVGLNGQVYYQKFDANGNSTTPYVFSATGQVQNITVGNDANGNPEVFALGLDNQVYTLKFNGSGDLVGGYNFTTPGQVKSFVVGHDAFNRPEVFALGLDNQVYYALFDTNGNAVSPYQLVDPGQVNSIAIGQTANGSPELFVIGLDSQVYAHHFTTAGVSDHRGYFRAFFRPGDPQGTLYQVKAITVGHDGSNNPELFATGLDNQIYAERYDSAGNPDPVGFFIAAIGQVGQISIGYDSNNDPELFAIGLDGQVYFATFDANGRPTAPYNLLTPGQVFVVTATP